MKKYMFVLSCVGLFLGIESGCLAWQAAACPTGLPKCSNLSRPDRTCYKDRAMASTRTSCSPTVTYGGASYKLKFKGNILCSDNQMAYMCQYASA